MPITGHPLPGCILECNFDHAFIKPEMQKNRPVVIISKATTARPHLCTVVALSNSEPNTIMPYHMRLNLPMSLRDWGQEMWVKGDMINTVSFQRLNFIRLARNPRDYYRRPIKQEDLNEVYKCVLSSITLNRLTEFL